MTTFAPRTADEATDAIRWALAAREALEVVGGGSKRALGRPVSAAHVLDVAALSGIVSYEPAELVLTALAGTRMSLIEAELAEHAQCFAFEPPDFAALLGVTGTGSTLGGVIASGLSGPRRFKAGAARDHLLGIAAVSGRGEAFVGGGKVVKNVTGYDIPKLMAGSYGTLAVLTEITMKVLPAPERASTVLIGGLSVRAAVREMTRALQSSLEVSGACHFPAGIAVPGRVAAAPVTAFRLEGWARSVEARLQSLRELLASLDSVGVLEDEESSAFWRGVRDVSAFANAQSGVDEDSRTNTAMVWRLSVPPAASAAVVERLERAVTSARMFLDWGGGLIWLAARLGADGAIAAHAARVREALGNTGGHAMLFRAPAQVRANVEVFQSQSAVMTALTKRLKGQFDPTGVLNPGRMYAGV